MKEDLCRKAGRTESYFTVAVIGIILVTLASIGVLRYGVQGPRWDTCNYLTNALFFSGNKDMSFVIQPIRPPLISILTAIPFYIGTVTDMVISYIDAFAFILGGISLFFLMRQRFPCPVSFAGTLIYASCIPVLEWIGYGYSTLFGVSISIAFVLLIVLSSEKNPLYALLLWPAGMLMVLSWEAAPLLITMPLFYSFFRWKKFVNYRYHLIGLLFALISYLPFSFVLNKAYGGPIEYLSIVFSNVVHAYGGIRANPGDAFIVMDRFYYVKQMPHFLSPYEILGYAAITLIIIGIVIVMKRISYSFNRSRELFIIYMSVIAVAFIASLAFTFIISAILVASLLLMLGRYSRAYQHQSVAMDMMCYFWFFLLFSYYTNIDVKVTRLMISFAPALAYIIAIGINGFYGLKGSRAKRIAGMSSILAVVLFSSVSIYVTMEPYDLYCDNKDGESYSCINGLVLDVTDHLKEEDPDYASKNIHSMLWTYASWFLMQNVHVTDVNLFPERLEYELQMYGADYYIGAYRDISTFEYMYNNGEVFLFRRAVDVSYPEILYIGRNLENYIGEVLDYQYYVRNGESYIREFSGRIDDFTLEELQEYDVLLLYNFQWNNFSDAQDLLESYVASGGKVIIDTSGNMDSGIWDFTFKTLLGVSSEREPYEPVLELTYVEPFRDAYSISEFVMEDGKEWMGMTYVPLDVESFSVLIGTENNVLLAHQTLGEGDVYWIGGNLIYHAYSTYNLEERRLIQEIFGYVYES